MFQRAVIAICLSLAAPAALASDRLVVLSPHRKTIQEELIPLFQTYYMTRFGTAVEVEWVDQGGTSNAVRYLKTKAASNPAAVGLDVFWGGTAANFVDMATAGLLDPYELPAEARAEIPRECAGVALSDSQNRWHAAVISSFGIMFNKKALALEGLTEPRLWADLAAPPWFDRVSLTDPRKSGTNSTMNMIVLAAEGWDKGWAALTQIAANTRRFTDSSSDPVRAVAAGDAVAAMTIDFYGLSQVWELGEDKIGFVFPEKQTVLDPDPVAVVKGGGNKETAHRFVDFLMTREAQKVWLLPKGAKGGPVRANLARLAVSPKAYEETAGRRLGLVNPFTRGDFLKFDLEKAGIVRDTLNDLYGAVLVDAHADLKKAWKHVIDGGQKPELVAALLAAPVTEAELRALAPKWGDEVFRNQTLNKWSAAAKARYAAIADGKLPVAH